MTKWKAMKRWKKALILVGIVLAALVIGFLIYAADYYHADAQALSVPEHNPRITTQGNLTVIPATGESDTALIFYPGAKVEHTAYLPILQQIADRGVTCVLVRMPLNMAIFDTNAADAVFEKLPEVKNWYIGGHSMGGAMASSYASKHPEKVRGLILLGAYVYGGYPPQDALTVYGTFNSNLEKDINYTQNIVVIEGGNHAQFGNYGPQRGDPAATISAQEQQSIAVDAIMQFIKEKNG